MKIWLTGGAGSGKSALAQKIAVHLSGSGRRYYLATMIPRDAEDEERIRRHREERRDLDFETILCAERLPDEEGEGQYFGPDAWGRDAVFLLDSATALLANRMFGAKATAWHPDAAQAVLDELLAFSERAAHLIVVSDGIYADGCRYGDMTEQYREGLALIERGCAARFDVVIECAAGGARAIKGGDLIPSLLA